MKKIHLGCGSNILKDWTNVDLVDNPKVIKHDLRMPLPFKDNSVDFFFSEAFFEHLTRNDGVRLLREVYRCLKPNGVSRIGTPDLDFLVEAYTKNDLAAYSAIKFVARNKCELMNLGMRDWGHLYLYDTPSFLEVHAEAGFKNYILEKHGYSSHSELNNLEFRLYTGEIICEATK